MSDEKPEGVGPAAAENQVRPTVDFTSFILSLSGSVLVNLGEVPDPSSGKREVNAELARQTIDVLALIVEKTKGNLTPEEQGLMDNLLPDLKIRYLKVIKYLA